MTFQPEVSILFSKTNRENKNNLSKRTIQDYVSLGPSTIKASPNTKTYFQIERNLSQFCFADVLFFRFRFWCESFLFGSRFFSFSAKGRVSRFWVEPVIFRVASWRSQFTDISCREWRSPGSRDWFEICSIYFAAQRNIWFRGTSSVEKEAKEWIGRREGGGEFENINDFAIQTKLLIFWKKVQKKIEKVFRIFSLSKKIY